jgi:protein-disulfide isomerase-like protein with CxxC motif
MRLAAAALAVVAAAFFAARLHDHDRCEGARNDIFTATLKGAPPAAADVAAIREHCRGTSALVAVAGALHAQGRDDQAAPLAREATEEEPASAAAWRALAETAQAPAEARAAARRLKELDPAGAPLRGSLNRSAGRSTR